MSEALIPKPVAGLMSQTDIALFVGNVAITVLAPEFEVPALIGTLVEQFLVGTSVYQKIEVLKDIVQIADLTLSIIQRIKQLTGNPESADIGAQLKKISDSLRSTVAVCDGKSVADILCGALNGTDHLIDNSTQVVGLADALLKLKDTQQFKMGNKFETVSELIVALIENGYIRL